MTGFIKIDERPEPMTGRSKGRHVLTLNIEFYKYPEGYGYSCNGQHVQGPFKTLDDAVGNARDYADDKRAT
jgi:hypothetical protein